MGRSSPGSSQTMTRSMTTEMEKVCKLSSSKYAKIAGLQFQQGCSSVPVWGQLVRVKMSSARLSRLNLLQNFSCMNLIWKDLCYMYTSWLVIAACTDTTLCEHSYSKRLAALIKSLSTADWAKNKYIKNRLSFGSRISHIHHFYFVMLLFLMLLFYISGLGKLISNNGLVANYFLWLFFLHYSK